jgi:hypothetical protein
MDVNSKVKEAISYGSKKLGYKSLREVQQIVVEAYLIGEDVFVSVCPRVLGRVCALR